MNEKQKLELTQGIMFSTFSHFLFKKENKKFLRRLLFLGLKALSFPSKKCRSLLDSTP